MDHITRTKCRAMDLTAWLCLLPSALFLRQSLRLKLKEVGWEESFAGFLEALGKVRAVEIEDKAGLRCRFWDEIPTEAMPAFRVPKMTPPKLVEKLT